MSCTAVWVWTNLRIVWDFLLYPILSTVSPVKFLILLDKSSFNFFPPAFLSADALCYALGAELRCAEPHAQVPCFGDKRRGNILGQCLQ